MSAPDREPKDGLSALALRLYLEMDYRQQCTWRNALERIVDGQPFEDAMVEAAVELGAEPAAARATVQGSMARKVNWRVTLN